MVIPAQFLGSDNVHVVFGGDGEEDTSRMRRGRLLSEAILPPQRLVSKMAANIDELDVVIVEDEDERLKVTAQRVRERRERMNNEIRRLKHFNNIIGREGKGHPSTSVHTGRSQPSGGEGDYLGRSMCQPAPPPVVGVVHRSFSLPGDKTLRSSGPDPHSSDLDSSVFGLQPLPEKDMPVLKEEGSGDLESLDIESIPENEIYLSDYEL